MKLACENINLAVINGLYWRMKELSEGQLGKGDKCRHWVMNYWTRVESVKIWDILHKRKEWNILNAWIWDRKHLRINQEWVPVLEPAVTGKMIWTNWGRKSLWLKMWNFIYTLCHLLFWFILVLCKVTGNLYCLVVKQSLVNAICAVASKVLVSLGTSGPPIEKVNHPTCYFIKTFGKLMRFVGKYLV